MAGAAAVAVPLLTGTMPPAGNAGWAGPARPRPVAAQRPVPVYVVHGHAVKLPAMRAWHPPATRWPAAGTATVGLASAAGAATAPGAAGVAVPGAHDVRAGGLPVWAGPAAGTAAGGTAGTAAGSPSKVRVTMASQQVARALGISGVVFTAGRADGADAAGRVHVSLSYAGFAYAYGGDYASRLHLVQLPACALTSPQVPACRVQTPLASADNVRADSLGADVTLPPAPAAAQPPATQPAAAASAASRVVAAPAAGAPAASAGAGATAVLAATAAPSGSAGDYTATPLSEAGTWAEGGSSGAFNYSYPITVPPVPGGLEPDVSLGYNSQAVDGLTSSANAQASWIGDGWDYSPGYVERSYQSCEQNSGSQKSGDFCWSSNDILTISLNGQNTTLVQDGSTGTWHAEADGNEKVSYVTGGSNGTHDGGYWVVTTPDGTSYYFGMNQLPGYASGDAATNSAWTIPVFATASGQPCYNSTFANSWCNQAWRWNLDYVTDPHGDAVAYFYNTATNYYARDNGTTGTALYTRAGALSKIEYGLRAGSIYGATPAAQVNFTTGTSRTDVPSDLSCSSGATCNVQSPTFWTKYQLTTIATQALEGSSLANVDSYALAQSYPSTGDTTTPPSLWLNSVTRTGKDGTSASLPPVTFAGTALPNRVETQTDLTDGYSIITRLRMTSITNETGGVISVNYLAPSGPCAGSGSFPAPDANTLSCYPAYWTPPGQSSPWLDWFNKYAVGSVSQEDTTGNTQPMVTNYSYAGAAWHYDDDALTRSKNRTWDQWRGFQTVTTQTGASPDPVTKTKDTYFQGMDGDYQANGSTTSASLASTQGDKVTDSDQFAGKTFEHIAYNGTGGPMVTDTITIPWTSGATATKSQPSPLPPLTAHLTGTAETKEYTALAGGGNRESDTTYTHDSYGRVTAESAVPDTSDPSEDSCTTTSYATSTSAWIMDLPAEEKVVSVPCTTTPSFPANAVSDTLTFYDGSTTLGAAPSKGDTTRTQLATSYNGATPVYTTKSAASYDRYGRVLTATDADNRTTTTAYTPATGAEPTSVAVTDPMGFTNTTAYDQARDLPTKVTDPAGYVTSKTYDALGRLTAAWKAGHPQGSSKADETFSYTVSATAPSVITTNTIGPAGGYTTSETLYDSLGRVRETQSATADGSRDVTDTLYNSEGWKVLTSDPYYATGAPSATLVAAQDSQVPSQTGYVYDGAGRVVKQISYKFATETRETDTAYGGNYTTVSYKNLVPGEPTGGTPQTTFNDGRGLTSAIYQYHAGVTPDPSGSASGYDKTTYTYTPAGKLATITDAAGNGWSYSYDLAGDKVSETDPDTGTATSTFDAAGQLMSATDARGKTTSYTYDADGRKTAEYDTTGGAQQTSADEVASWTYDTLKKGMLTSSASYVGGTGGAAYTNSVTGYNSFGLPVNTKVIIPSGTQTGALAGTYETGFTYNAYTTQVSSYYDTAAGGLPAETVSTGYDNSDEPTSVGSSLWSYVGSLSYTELGQPLEYTMGTGSEPAWLMNTYDQQTGRLTEAKTVTGTSATTVADFGYRYDNVGNVTSESDSTAGDYQCFGYDYLGRLTDAWAQGSAGCAATPSASALGGPSPYWQHLAYDVAGNITTNNWTYNTAGTNTVTNANSYGPSQPHAMTSQNVVSSAYGYWTNKDTYDAAGNQTTRRNGGTTQQLTWNDQGKLAQVSDNSGNTTSYTYDAAGNLLLQSDPGTVTLYLPDEQLVLNTATGAITGTRYYQLGGVTIASRSSTGQISYLISDLHGTSQLAIDSGTLAVSRRYYTPSGALRYPWPGSWPAGNKGYVGGTTDPTTALTNLGAREYDTSGGTFTSPDPLLKPYDPQDLNPYAYAEDSPVSNADPAGLMLPGGSQCGIDYPCNTGGGGGGGGSHLPICYYCYDPHSGGSSGGGSSGGGSSGGGGWTGGGCNLFALSCGGPPPGIAAPGYHPSYPRYIPPAPVVHKVTNGSSASQATCSVADLRFGLDPGCKLAPPPSGGGFNPFHWFAHSAVPWVVRHIPSFTVGICATGLFNGGIAAEGSGCAVMSYDRSRRNVQFGFTGATGVGLGMPSIGYSVGPMISNAPRISDLGGPFGKVGGSGELGTISAGGDVSVGTSPSNRQIVVLSGGLGQSLDLPFVVAGFEIHGLYTYTWTATVASFHL
jgi:RHS repeat-associated protein